VRSEQGMRTLIAERASDNERRTLYDQAMTEMRTLSSAELRNTLLDVANQINKLEGSREFSMDPGIRAREHARVVAIYKKELEVRALAARDTARSRLQVQMLPVQSLPQFGYKSTNPIVMTVVPLDLQRLAAALAETQ